jgi:hypothetical protein
MRTGRARAVWLLLQYVGQESGDPAGADGRVNPVNRVRSVNNDSWMNALPIAIRPLIPILQRKIGPTGGLGFRIPIMSLP